MSISSEVTRIQTNIANAYTACSDKGATMPDTQNSANLADTITSIPTGGGGSGTHTISYYDIDGTLLYQDTVTAGNTYTVPANYTANYDSTYLDFRGWTCQRLKSTLDDRCVVSTEDDLYAAMSGGIYRDYEIGAVYSNKTPYKGLLKITIPSNNYEVEFSEGFYRTGFSNNSHYGGTYNLIVDWGDSTTSTITREECLASAASGNTVDFYPFTHTYTTAGNYVIQYWFEAEGKNYSQYNYGETVPSSYYIYYFGSGDRVHFCTCSSESAKLITHLYDASYCPSTVQCYYDSSSYMPPVVYRMENLTVFNSSPKIFFQQYSGTAYEGSGRFNYLFSYITLSGNSYIRVSLTPKLKVLIMYSVESNTVCSIVNYADCLERLLSNTAHKLQIKYIDCPKLKTVNYFRGFDSNLASATATYSTNVTITYCSIDNCPIAKATDHDLQIAPVGYYDYDSSTFYLDPDDFPTAVSAYNYYSIANNYKQPSCAISQNLKYYKLENVICNEKPIYLSFNSNSQAQITNVQDAHEVYVGGTGSNFPKFDGLPSLEKLDINLPNVTSTINGYLRNMSSAFTELDLTKCTSLATITSNSLTGSYVNKIKIPSSLTNFGSTVTSTSYTNGAVASCNCKTFDMSGFHSTIKYNLCGCFYNCENLLSVKFANSGVINSGFVGSGTISLSEYVFSDCNVLQEVELPSWIVSMGGKWFQNANNIQKIWIPSTVTTIGNGTNMGYYPFYGYTPYNSSYKCTIYTDASEPLPGWGTYWNAYGTSYSSSNVLPVVYNATIEDYRAA